MQDLARQGRQRYAKRWLGREVTVLVENGGNEKNFCRGISENYLKLHVRYNGEKAPAAGSVLRCRISCDQAPGFRNEEYDAAAVEE